MDGDSQPASRAESRRDATGRAKASACWTKGNQNEDEQKDRIRQDTVDIMG